MNFDQQTINLIVQVLLIAGALNWGSVALNYPDFVTQIAGAQFGTYVKLAVGAAGAYAAYQLFLVYQATRQAAPPQMAQPLAL